MGIDWVTLGFEVLNFLILLWMLNRWVFRPLGRAIRDRRKSIDDAVAAAKADREAAAEERSQVERDRKDLVALRDRVRQEALEDAVAERTRLLEQAKEDASEERSRVRQLLDAEHEAAEAWVLSAAIDRSTELAGKLLLALAPDALAPALVDRLVDAIHARAAALRPEEAGGAAAGAPAQDEPLDAELVGATLPDDATRDRIRDALAEVTGRTPRLRVAEDPSLRAGLRLRAGDALLDASLAGQLEAFRDLARDLAEEPAEAAAHA